MQSILLHAHFGGGFGAAQTLVERRMTDALFRDDRRQVRHDGNKRVIEGAEAMTLLPGKQRPVVQYLGAGADGERAGFVVSPEVVSAAGDGNCDPGRNDCQFLSMRAGDSQTFRYGEDERIRLDLLAINRVVTEKTGSAG